jgi:hypothetical protein
MELQCHELESGILGISLAGRMDGAGAQQIDLRGARKALAVA